ncbi:MAG: hypothetical protein J5767_12860 [Paludibacteraceae bacterium]|nr:hypothetical protein [Paludibacteraceae bacterium]
MSLNQEQINTLRHEIPMIGRQIELMSGPEFQNTVPEVATAIAALKHYKEAAEAHVAEWDRAHQPPIQSRLLNLNAFYNPGATPAPTQPVAQPAQTAPVAGIDPNLLQAITQNPLAMALLKTALQAQTQQQQG